MVNQGDAAEEQRRTWYLGIVEREMAAAESHGGKVAAAQRMLQNAKDDPSKLCLLVEQLPSMFAGTDFSWIETTLAEVNPELGAAVTDCRRAGQAVAMSDYAAQSVRDGFQSGLPPTQIGRSAAAVSKYDPDSGKRFPHRRPVDTAVRGDVAARASTLLGYATPGGRPALLAWGRAFAGRSGQIICWPTASRVGCGSTVWVKP